MSGQPCPKCGDPLSKDGQCGSCGYKQQRTSNANTDPQINRCAYVSNGERCWHIGTWAYNTHGAGPRFCRGHSRGDSAAVGQRVVEESRQHKRQSYETADLVAETREAYINGWRDPVPVARAPVAAGVVPNSFKRVYDLVGPLFADAEAQAEREAIQAEGS